MSVVRFGIPDIWEVGDPRAVAWRESRHPLGVNTKKFSRFPISFREKLRLWHHYPKLRRRRLSVSSGGGDVNCHGFTFGANGWLCPSGDFWWAGAKASDHLSAWKETLDGLGFREFDSKSSFSVALYCDPLGYVTHSARRLTTGRWASKLGAWVYVRGHQIQDLEDPCYGKAALLLSK